MRHIGVVMSLVAMGCLVSCDGNKQQEDGDGQEKIMDEPLKQQDAEQDTTLQEVEEVTIRAVGTDEQSMVFDQDTLEVSAGSLVRLGFVNEGTDPKMIYNIVFTKPGLHEKAAQQGAEAGASGNYLPDSTIMIAGSPLALPGQTVKMEFKAPKEPGIYDYVSTYPGTHSRMNGKLIVK